MPSEERCWAQDQEAEIAILHAIVVVMALRSKIDARTLDRIPSLRDLIAVAGTVAKEIGWDDEVRSEI
ncbi:MAG TPA: hypothetical protein VEZ16_01140 [Microvirga sp.]|nr:hypothetical protein [Microvirga sp.]